VLERTLGVPLFQEQMLEIAQVMANFTGDEAEELRRAMSFHRSDERMTRAVAKLRAAMAGCHVPPAIADQIVKAVGSFALYGFPESHAISFAHLAYASAWLKVHRAPEFYCGLLNNQPMGFYSAATLVKDAKRHGVSVRPVCVMRSQSAATIDSDGAIRLGLLQVRGLRREHAEELVAQRSQRAFASLEDLRRRTPLTKDELRTLAEVGALNALAPHRRAALWQVEEELRVDELLPAMASGETGPERIPLQPMQPMERLQADFESLQLTTGPHPMAFLRPKLAGIWRATDLASARHGDRVRVAGMVICRQRPGTAKGVVFVSLEDETGIANVIVSAAFFEENRLEITSEPFLIFEGPLQHRHGTIHVRAAAVERLETRELRPELSHDFH
jgi:error-prone DNA polymerase